MKVEDLDQIKALVGDVSYPLPEITGGHTGDNMDCSLVEHPYICVMVTSALPYGQHLRRYKVVDKRYLDIERVKLSPDDNFAVVTLKKNKIYDIRGVKNISPFCLPENPADEFEGKAGKVFGFAYTENIQQIKDRNTFKLMIERKASVKDFTISSARECIKHFGRMALKRKRNGEKFVWLKL